MPRILLLPVACLSVWLASCCEPGHKDSQPILVDSAFQETYGRDLDVFTSHVTGLNADSAYFPIYTFGIRNNGTADDDFTLSFRYSNQGYLAGFDITKHVPAGQMVLFRTPSPTRDSSAIYHYPNLNNPSDSIPSMDKAYYGIQASTPDSTEIHTLRPTISVTYGLIDNGPEACNTPASTQQIDLNELPRR
ncbi:MAG: hypothetical protein Q8922_13445 [Bacteroidota bacterium]|nr:hypothetical protein [Bacteroidota bacterium]MDP4233861.1 hypothetical protein [Bacteroidota bacterium]MDP4243534.1 hypothetical protein [Bacteroidota bacterium]MDP4288927.1 hypothetical protein [Bacteroidota bacterium]